MYLFFFLVRVLSESVEHAVWKTEVLGLITDVTRRKGWRELLNNRKVSDIDVHVSTGFPS